MGCLIESSANFESIEAVSESTMVGTEHVVELSDQRGRFLKLTKPPSFGLVPYINLVEAKSADPTIELPPRPSLEFRGSSPIEYLARWQASNELFGDDVRLASVVIWKDGDVSGFIEERSHSKY